MKDAWEIFLRKSKGKKIVIITNLIGIIIAVGVTFTGLLPETYFDNVIILLLGLLLIYVTGMEFLRDTVQKDSVILLPKEKSMMNNLKDFFDKYDEFYFIGISNEAILNIQNLDALRHASSRNKAINIILIDPEVEVFEEILKYKSASKVSGSYASLAFYNSHIATDPEMSKKICVYRCDINLPFAMVMARKADKIKYVKVDLYGVHTNDSERLSFVINNNSVDILDYYDKQCKKILNAAREYEKQLLNRET